MIYWILEQLGEWLTRQGLYRYVMVLEQLNFRVFCSGVLSFLCVVLFGKRVIRWLSLKKIGDAAEFNHAQLNEMMKSKANTPTMGGLLIAASIFLATFVFSDLSNDYIKLGIFVLLYHAAIGGFDDWLKLTAASRASGSRQGLYSWEKLVCQLGLGMVIAYFAFAAGGAGQTAAGEESYRMAHVLNLPFQKTYDPAGFSANENLIYLSALVYVAFMTIFMAGMSNAVNITDGMDGLAAGIAAIVGLGMVVLCVVVGTETIAQPLLVPYVPASGELAVLGGALVGACLGFLWWNCSPASVFMGDTGSLCLGGLIGYIAVVIRMEYVILLMCGIYIWEIASVVMQVGYFKATKGKRIFKCAPYHHHLHMSGWPEQRIVARFWIMTILLTAMALASLKLR
jgi:phospho-N-acetylmuramoyl-pentapeptide-transferase